MSNERQQAARIKKGLAEQCEALRRQKNLTDEGRRSRMAKAMRAAEAKNAGLRQDYEQGLSDRGEALTQKALGFGHTRPDDARAVSIRDARDRAARFGNPAEMEDAMGMAELDGDTVFLKACARECFRRSSNLLERGWGDLFNKWADSQPGLSDAVAELRDIRTELHDPTHILNRQAEFGVGRPPELRGLSNTQIDALAAQADDIEELPPTRAEQVGQRLAAFARGDGGGY